MREHQVYLSPGGGGALRRAGDPAALWGAKAIVADGALENPKVDAIFGLQITPMGPVGIIGYRSGPMMAGADGFCIRVTGRQTHGSQPWGGVDPIVAAAQIILGLQTIVSRELKIADEHAVLSIGAINGGNRENVVPDSVEMLGTLRTFDPEMRADAKKRIARTAESIAAASAVKAEINFTSVAYPPTVNPASLTEAAVPVLAR